MLLGAVDLGSNSFRIEIGRVEDGRIVTEGYWKETVRLSAGLDTDGNFTQEVQERALAALHRFREKLEGIDPKCIRAVGTQALRIAKNAAEFLPKAEQALGHPIEIIAGREEARLVFAGCVHTLPPSSEKRLIVDIGGGSTELIVGYGLIPKRCESFHVGCVNTSVDFFPDGKITPEAFHQATMFARAEFEEVVPEFNHRNWDAAYGSAGTIGAVADIGHASGLTNGVVTPALLKYLRDQLIEKGSISEIDFPGLKKDRKEVIAGGLAVLTAVFETFNIKEMRPAPGALRVGLLHDLLGRHNQQDTRDKTVTALIKRVGLDKQQAARVAGLTDAFFVALNDNRPEQEQRKLLQWAAMLHESGRSISPSGYHHHSKYILLHADLAGFSRDDQKQMAAAVLAQRGNLLKVKDALVDPVFVRMACALRLGIIFAHSRRLLRLPKWSLTCSDAVPQRIELSIDATWLDNHSLIKYLLEQESVIWARVGRQFVLTAS